jgi:hypothetical protein
MLFLLITMDIKVTLDVQISTKTLQKNTYVKVIDFASDYSIHDQVISTRNTLTILFMTRLYIREIHRRGHFTRDKTVTMVEERLCWTSLKNFAAKFVPRDSNCTHL